MKKTLLTLSLLLAIAIVGATVVQADHAWVGKKNQAYHWDQLELNLGDNLTTQAWKDSLGLASSDWNVSVLDTTVVPGSSNANCDPVLGSIEACNDEYGDTGWLGIAQIWVYNGADNHIAQALVKVNDTYYNSPEYDTQEGRNYVMCQEVGHTFGLGHQDEDFTNEDLGTCMDYTSNFAGNQHPNQHDYDMLALIYDHVVNPDTGNGGPGNGKGGGNGKGKPADTAQGDHAEFGHAVSYDAQDKVSLYRKDLGNGQTVFTHVFWLPEGDYDHSH